MLTINRINIRKFCPTVIGCYYWNGIPISINKKKRKLENYLKSTFTTFVVKKWQNPKIISGILIYALCRFQNHKNPVSRINTLNHLP